MQGRIGSRCHDRIAEEDGVEEGEDEKKPGGR